MDCTRTLKEIFERHVRYDEGEMIRNKRIAEHFVHEFLNDARKQHVLDGPELIMQGSTYEGLKIGKADEFDYLITMNYCDRSHLINPVNTSDSGYWQLLLQGNKLKGRAWVQRYAQVDRLGRLALLPHAYQAQLQTAVNRFVTSRKNFTIGTDRIHAENPSIGKSAATVNIKINGQFAFAVDLAIGIKVQLGGKTKIFFAKRSESDDHAFLWLHRVIEEELHTIQKMPEKIKTNYRIAKYLLKPVVVKFSLKAALLHLYHDKRNDKLEQTTDFLNAMITFLQQAYARKSLPAFGNPDEDIIARCPDDEIAEAAKILNQLTRMKMIDVIEFLEKKAAKQ